MRDALNIANFNTSNGSALQRLSGARARSVGGATPRRLKRGNGSAALSCNGSMAQSTATGETAQAPLRLKCVRAPQRLSSLMRRNGFDISEHDGLGRWGLPAAKGN